VRARAQPLLGVLRPLVIVAGDLNVLVRHAATVLPAPRGGRQSPFGRSDEDDSANGESARPRRSSRRSATRQVGALREDQLRLRTGCPDQHAERRVRDRAPRPEPAARRNASPAPDGHSRGSTRHPSPPEPARCPFEAPIARSEARNSCQSAAFWPRAPSNCSRAASPIRSLWAPPRRTAPDGNSGKALLIPG
jgi:hypothetical protein